MKRFKPPTHFKKVTKPRDRNIMLAKSAQRRSTPVFTRVKAKGTGNNSSILKPVENSTLFQVENKLDSSSQNITNNHNIVENNTLVSRVETSMWSTSDPCGLIETNSTGKHSLHDENSHDYSTDSTSDLEMEIIVENSRKNHQSITTANTVATTSPPTIVERHKIITTSVPVAQSAMPSLSTNMGPALITKNSTTSVQIRRSDKVSITNLVLSSCTITQPGINVNLQNTNKFMIQNPTLNTPPKPLITLDLILDQPSQNMSSQPVQNVLLPLYPSMMLQNTAPLFWSGVPSLNIQSLRPSFNIQHKNITITPITDNSSQVGHIVTGTSSHGMARAALQHHLNCCK